LAGFEITHAEALRPFVLVGALVIIGAAVLWLIDEFIWPVGRQLTGPSLAHAVLHCCRQGLEVTLFRFWRARC
jgi:hypothetical protein